ncbi:MAG TPA: ElyC/SanA/YdcF family protein [Longimicrobiaceae bacterium]|nr:ElyC/SanA/YdcF family protein [Longimicrobiaceae bacterium]
MSPRLRRAGAAALALLLAALAAYALRAPLLTGAARLLTVRDSVTRADLILVLGGEVNTRPAHAAELYRRGVAPRVVLVRERAGPAVEAGLYPGRTEVAVRILRRDGVPDSAITVLAPPRGASSTAEEAAALRAHLARTGTRRVAVVTNPYHSRRARMALRRATRGLRVEVLLSPTPAWGFTERDWWRSEDGLVAYFNEWVKLAAYLLRGR